MCYNLSILIEKEHQPLKTSRAMMMDMMMHMAMSMRMFLHAHLPNALR